MRMCNRQGNGFSVHLAETLLFIPAINENDQGYRN